MLKFLSEWGAWIIAVAGLWFIGWSRVVHLSRNLFIISLFFLALIIMVGTLKFANDPRKVDTVLQQIEGNNSD